VSGCNCSAAFTWSRVLHAAGKIGVVLAGGQVLERQHGDGLDGNAGSARLTDMVFAVASWMPCCARCGVSRNLSTPKYLVSKPPSTTVGWIVTDGCETISDTVAALIACASLSAVPKAAYDSNHVQ
jgi:hypothetical protein